MLELSHEFRENTPVNVVISSSSRVVRWNEIWRCLVSLSLIFAEQVPYIPTFILQETVYAVCYQRLPSIICRCKYIPGPCWYVIVHLNIFSLFVYLNNSPIKADGDLKVSLGSDKLNQKKVLNNTMSKNARQETLKRQK